MMGRQYTRDPGFRKNRAVAYGNVMWLWYHGATASKDGDRVDERAERVLIS
jgi:hypothetical protein